MRFQPGLDGASHRGTCAVRLPEPPPQRTAASLGRILWFFVEDFYHQKLGLLGVSMGKIIKNWDSKTGISLGMTSPNLRVIELVEGKI